MSNETVVDVTKQTVGDAADRVSLSALELLEKFLSGVDSAGALLANELPVFIHQMMLWYGLSSFVLFSVSLASTVFFSYWARKFYKKSCVHTRNQKMLEALVKESRYDISALRCAELRAKISVEKVEDSNSSLLAGVSAFIAVMSVVTLGSSLTWLKILIAPNLWLAQSAAELLK